MSKLKRKYPKTTSKGIYYVKHPISVTEELMLTYLGRFNTGANPNYVVGQWIAVNVLLPEGYKIPFAPLPYGSEKECQRACDIHNEYHGWNKEEVRLIIADSMGLIKK